MLIAVPVLPQEKKQAEKKEVDKTEVEKKKDEEKKADEKKADEKQPALSEQAAAFRKMNAEFKGLVARLKEIQYEYKEVKPDSKKRQTLEQEFDAKKLQAEKMLPGLRAAAEKAIATDPTYDELIDFLGAFALDAEQRGDDAEVLRLAQLVLNHETKARASLPPPEDQVRRPELHRMAAKAAFFLSQWEADSPWGAIETNLKALEKHEEFSDGFVRDIAKALPEERKYWEAELKARAAEARPVADPQALARVKLETTQGDIVVELFENEAPNTVANFISLVQSKFYDGKPFYEVSMDQALSGRPAATENPLDYTIPFEATSDKFRRNFRGSLFMNAPSKDEGASEFGINLRRSLPSGDATFDDKGKYLKGRMVFGRVVSGFEALNKLKRIDPYEDPNVEPDRINKATLLPSKRKQEYTPKKVMKEKAKENKTQELSK
jgi:cyclophilin family peptidyl-prolyl cis-trans isomerase